jgi:hypothetical protein
MGFIVHVKIDAIFLLKFKLHYFFIAMCPSVLLLRSDLYQMKKDIEIPIVKNVYVAAVLMTGDTGEQQWWVHLINDSTSPLENVMIQSRGYSNLETKAGIKTATLRKVLQVLPAKSAAKLEPIMPEVFHLFNEYWVTFFEENTLKDRKFIFGPHTIEAAFQEDLPVVKDKGIIVR